MLKEIVKENSVQSRVNTFVTAPPVICESCGKVVQSRDQAINIILVVGSPGHPDLPPFQCPGGGDSYGDHWACSLECWRQVAHACIEEHMQELLKFHRAKVGL